MDALPPGIKTKKFQKKVLTNNYKCVIILSVDKIVCTFSSVGRAPDS